SCSPVPLPGCTDPNLLLQKQVDTNRIPLVPLTQSYPARRGPDAFYGYGRVNMAKAIAPVLSSPQAPGPSLIPPEADTRSPDRFSQVNPSRSHVPVDGQVFAR